MKTLALLLFGSLFLSEGTTELKVKSDDVAINWKLTDGHNGTLNGIEATILFDSENPAESSFDVKLDVSTINTENPKRDAHLKSKDYLDAETYPHIIFRSNTVEQTETGFNLNGKLEVKGTTSEINIPFNFEKAETGGTFTGTLDVNTTTIGIPGLEGSENDALNCHVDIKVPVML